MRVPILIAVMANAAIAQTNYTVAHPDFREVDGKVYNRAKSILWRDITARYVKTETNGTVVLRLFEVQNTYAPPERLNRRDLARSGLFNSAPTPIPIPRRVVSSKEIPGKHVIVRNFQCAGKPVPGDKVSIRALPVGEADWGGDTVGVYDCGKPHIVPVAEPARAKKDGNTGARASKP
jgi:hypothetical protein